MANLVTRFLNQIAVHWSSPTADGYGQAIWEYPVQIVCRWEELLKLDIDTHGEEIVCQARVFVPPALDVAEGDYMKLGALSSIDSDSGYDSEYDSDIISPEDISGAYRVKKIEVITSVSSRDSVKMVWL